MLPNYYECTGCGEVLRFAQREARYLFGFDPRLAKDQVSRTNLYSVPARPAWCKDCAMVCLVEDIAPLRTFEVAFGVVRAGGSVAYPIATECMEPQEALDALETYLRWRMDRRHPSRALCCGRTNYQFLDVEQPLLKHQACDFGVVEPRYLVSSFNGPGPGVTRPANIHVYDGEGVLVGLMTWRAQDSNTWTVVPAENPRGDDG